MTFAVAQLELSEPVAGVPVADHSQVRALARWKGRPIGWVWAARSDGEAVDGPTLSRAVLTQLGWELVAPALAQKEAYLAPAALPAISIVVCTRDRADSLADCLRSLGELDYPSFEVVVVDNASETDATRCVVEQFSFRYAREDRPGLDWARNRGIAESRHDIVAFTDDDVQVDAQWLRGIAAGFANPGVMAVTGLVAPRELETPAQVLFEHVYGGMGKGMTGKLFHRGMLRPAQLIAIHRVGVGANMAYRRTAFERIGTFDTALDVGTPASGAGDLDMFHRVIASGLALWYEPRALVWHRHRHDQSALETQLYNDGRSFTVYLIKLWRTGTVSRMAIARYAVWTWARWLIGRVVLGVFKRHRLPLPLLWAGLRGALGGPAAYIATYRHDRALRAASDRV